jgi:hypothetical protein
MVIPHGQPQTATAHLQLMTLTTYLNLQLTFPIGSHYRTSLQTTQKTLLPTVPLLVRVADSLPQKRVYHPAV